MCKDGLVGNGISSSIHDRNKMNRSILKKAYGKAYEVMDVTTQDFCKFLLITNIKSHERIFSPFALLVTSISFL